MELLNTNRLRISATNLRKHWNAPWFIAQHYRCDGDGKRRFDHVFSLHIFGRGFYVKWRPRGKRP